MFCKKCGATIDEDSIFCSRCGTKIPTTTAESLTKTIPREAPDERVSPGNHANKNTSGFFASCLDGEGPLWFAFWVLPIISCTVFWIWMLIASFFESETGVYCGLFLNMAAFIVVEAVINVTAKKYKGWKIWKIIALFFSYSVPVLISVVALIYIYVLYPKATTGSLLGAICILAALYEYVLRVFK